MRHAWVQILGQEPNWIEISGEVQNWDFNLPAWSSAGVSGGGGLLLHFSQAVIRHQRLILAQTPGHANLRPAGPLKIPVFPLLWVSEQLFMLKQRI